MLLNVNDSKNGPFLIFRQEIHLWMKTKKEITKLREKILELNYLYKQTNTQAHVILTHQYYYCMITTRK